MPTFFFIVPGLKHANAPLKLSLCSLSDEIHSPGMGNKVINRDVDGFSLLDVPQSRDYEIVVESICTEGKSTKQLK